MCSQPIHSEFAIVFFLIIFPISTIKSNINQTQQKANQKSTHFSQTQQKIIQDLVKTKDCGPILIRLSWHDAGVFSDGDLKGGCPNAVMRFTDAGDFAMVA